MMKKKDFDCVAMKDEIQRKLLADWQGMDDGQVVRAIRKNLCASKSSVGVWWRRAGGRRSANNSRVPAGIH